MISRKSRGKSRKKQIVSMMLAVLMVWIMLPMPAGNSFADEYPMSGSCGDNLTWTLTGEGVLTISGTGEMQAFKSYSAVPWYSSRTIIKTVVLENGVTNISDYAFGGCQNLESATIPEGITSIGKIAFSYCRNLKQLYIPDSVISIGAQAFEECSSLTSIVIPDSVTAIGRFAFQNCSNLQSIEIPDNINSIEYGTFKNCSSLTQMIIPGNVTSIGICAFEGCSSLTTIEIPDSVNSIGNGIFADCSNLTYVKLSDHLTGIPYSAFKNCYSLSGIEIPDSVTEIGSFAFSGCSEIKSIVIPGSVSTIEEKTFSACVNLTEIIIGDGVSTISSSVFSDCDSLTEITFPSSINSIDSYAFIYCKNLESITVDPNNTTYCSLDGVVYSKDLTSCLFCPAGRRGEYRIPDSVTEIGSCAFQSCAGLTNVFIPESVTSIGSNAFGNCSSLLSVCLPEGITSVGQIAFQGCSSLTSLVIPNSVQSIGDYAFSRCESLNSIVLPDGITSIGNDLFWGCSGLTEIDIPDSVTSIGAGSFCLCSSLKSIVLPDSITSIDSSVFYGCSSLISVTLPANLTEIPTQMFRECSSLDTVSIPNSVTSIGLYAFRSCTSLKSIKLPGNVSNINSKAFFDCSNIMDITVVENNETYCSVDGVLFNKQLSCLVIYPAGRRGEYRIPDSVTEIGSCAFENCAGLTNVSIPESVTSIGSNAFRNCSSLLSVCLPEGITSVGEYSFYYCKNLSNISWPESLNNIGMLAFGFCDDLKDVFYGGKKADWEELHYNFSQIHLFSSEDKDEQMDVSISLQQIPGGIAVTMNSTGSSVYYTLDGTMPCTGSIPYEGTFILDEAGEYFINAIAFNLEQGTYGSVSTEYYNLEQSAMPVIQENGNGVSITSNGPVYYTLDMTETPSVSSYQYTEPLHFENSSCVQARTIENGKAPSETVKYEWLKPQSMGVAYPADTYSFKNQAVNFGHQNDYSKYSIPKEQYISIFGSATGEFLYDMCGGQTVAGRCYGMCATALLFSRGILKLSDFSASASRVFDLHAPASPESNLTRKIEEFQIAQYRLMMEDLDIFNQNMIFSGESGNAGSALQMLKCVGTACSGGDPVILTLYSSGGSDQHAVIPYKVENGRIYIYDPNDPYFEGKTKENYISYSVNGSGDYSFRYNGFTTISYNLLSTLEKELDGMKGITRADEAALNAQEVSRILIASNSGDFSVLNEKGEPVTNYSVLSEGDNKVICLKAGKYFIQNNDPSLDELKISMATEKDYYTVVLDNPTAKVEVCVESDRLAFCVDEDREVKIQCHTSNLSGRQNDIEATAKHLKVYAVTELAILIDSDVKQISANGEETELSKVSSDDLWYRGSVAAPYEYSAMKAYRAETECTLSTDIQSKPDGTFSLVVYASGADEGSTIYAASYDGNGKMYSLNTRSIESGRTKYVFDIPEDAKEIKVIVTEHGTSRPLTANLRIY